MQIGEISVGITGTITSLKNTLAQARAESDRAARDMSNSFSNLDVGKRIGPGVATASASLGKLTAAFGAVGIAAASIRFGRESIQTGMEFEHTMKMVQAVTQATKEEYEALNKVAKNLGATTEFTAKQAAEGLKILGQAGLNAKNSMEALPGILDLATIGELSLAEATGTAVAAVNAFRLPMSEIGRINDVVGKTAVATNLDVKDMAESFKYAAPAAASFGYSIEELSGYLGLLGNLGIKGSMAGTQLAFAFQKVPDLFKSIGMDGEGKKLIDALELINQKGLKTGEILDIFGDRGGRAVLGLTTLTGQYSDFVKELENAQGTASEMAGIIRGSTLGSFKELQSTMEGLKIDVFAANQDLVNKGFKDITASIRAMNPVIVETSRGVGEFLSILERYSIGITRKYKDADIAIRDLATEVYAYTRSAIIGQEGLNKRAAEYDEQLRRINQQYKQFQLGEEHIQNMDSILQNAVANWKELTKTDKWNLSVGLDPNTEKGLEKINALVNEMFKGDTEAIKKINSYMIFRADRFGVSETDVRKRYNEVVEMIKSSFPKSKHEEMIKFISSQFETKFDIDLTPKIKEVKELPRGELQKLVKEWQEEIRSFREKEMGIETRDDYLKYMEGDVDKLKKIRDEAKKVYGEMNEASDYHRRPSGRAEIGSYDAKMVKENLKEIEDQWKEHDEALQKLTEGTFDSMRESVSDLYFKALEGDLKNFEDVYKSFMSSLKKITADYFAQSTITALFGEKGQGGGALSGILKSFNLFGSDEPELLAGAKGLVFGTNGFVPFGKGGVVNRPTIFPFANGVGLMGEAGDEGILPLKRDRSGNLGVIANGGGDVGGVQIIVNNYGKEEATVREGPRGGPNEVRKFYVTIGREVSNGGPVGQSMESTYGVKRRGIRR